MSQWAGAYNRDIMLYGTPAAHQMDVKAIVSYVTSLYVLYKFLHGRIKAKNQCYIATVLFISMIQEFSQTCDLCSTRVCDSQYFSMFVEYVM